MPSDDDQPGDPLERLGRELLSTERALVLAKFFLPLALSAVYLLTFPLVFRGRWEQMMGFVMAYFVPPFGKESIIPLAIGAGFNPLVVALYIALVDTLVGLFLVWNWDLSLRIPMVGAYIQHAIDSGKEVLEEREWIENLAFAGLVLFVMVPFQGSGAVGASVLGRMIGLPPYRVWFSIILGAGIGSFLLAVAGITIRYAFEQALGTGIAVLVAVLVIGIAGYYLWRSTGRSEDPPSWEE